LIYEKPVVENLVILSLYAGSRAQFRKKIKTSALKLSLRIPPPWTSSVNIGFPLFKMSSSSPFYPMLGIPAGD
jgi:hypothetical protein